MNIIIEVWRGMVTNVYAPNKPGIDSANLHAFVVDLDGKQNGDKVTAEYIHIQPIAQADKETRKAYENR